MSEASEHYTATAKWLLWLMAVIIIVVWVLGFYLADLPRGPDKSALIQLHKAIGSTVLILVAVRLAWRVTHTPPPLSSTIPNWQQTAAHGAHWVLYALMLAQPVTGWGISSALGYPVAIAGVIPLPALVGKDEGLADSFKEAHEFIGFTLAFLVAGHIAMALKHHLHDRDDTLRRMIPRHGSGQHSTNIDS
jgi:cytochrome b561